MNINRRVFLRGALVATGAIVVAPRLKLLPRLYFDGVHPDVEGLFALFNGLPVDLPSDNTVFLSADRIVIFGARMYIPKWADRWDDIPTNKSILISHCCISNTPNPNAILPPIKQPTFP